MSSSEPPPNPRTTLSPLDTNQSRDAASHTTSSPHHFSVRSPSFDLNIPEHFTTHSHNDEKVDPIAHPSIAREMEHRHGDDLELMKAERVASQEATHVGDDLYRSHSLKQTNSHSRNSCMPPDELDCVSTTRKERVSGPWKPKKEPATKAAIFLKKLHGSSVLVRYFTYIVPVVLVLLVPLLLGAFVYKDRTVGGVYLMWFMVWLEVVWLCLWAGRIIAKSIPYPVYFIASAVTNGSKKWRDMARMLEVPATLFFWWLGIYCSFLPVMRGNHTPEHKGETFYWERTGNIVLLSLFIATILNFVEKILIQLIAISFHQRTYADRIELNKFQISSLGKLYAFAKVKEKERLMFDGTEAVNEKEEPGSFTPRVVLQGAGRAAQQAMNRVGDVVGKIAGDFTGRNVLSSTSPQQVVITLLQTTEGSNVLARRLYRAFRHPDLDHVRETELKAAFGSEDESEAAFSMFDRDMNGDISCEEMELACVEIGRERKAISASLKDLDSVISRFDACLSFIVAVITIVVFLSLISKSTAGVLTSASSSVLALSWLFSGTAQEFLASLVFVFVKHPFDVGDRVDIYNTGTNRIDTFYVKEIALMYTEFKRPEGHVVQAPNSLLNTLFILNMRRSGALAEAIPIVCKFGTTIDQIDDLRARMLDYVLSEKREFQGKILTELKDIPDMHSVNVNIVFFYRSNLQNELLRLRRRNMFMCALMCQVADLGIESPNMRWPGQKASAPVYLSGIDQEKLQQTASDPDAPTLDAKVPSDQYQFPKTAAPPGTIPTPIIERQPSLRSARNPDFTLGTTGISDDTAGDVFSDTQPRRGNLPLNFTRMNSVREDEEESDFVRSIKSHQSQHRDSSSFFRRRPLSNASNNSASRGARSFFSRVEPEPVLPRSEVTGGPVPTGSRGSGDIPTVRSC